MFISPQELKDLVTTSKPMLDYVIIDVRDDDFATGNIPGCVNIPSTLFMQQYRNYTDLYKHIPLVIFHCALSQRNTNSLTLSKRPKVCKDISVQPTKR
jgi:Cdc25 family phosphatase